MTDDAADAATATTPAGGDDTNMSDAAATTSPPAPSSRTTSPVHHAITRRSYSSPRRETEDAWQYRAQPATTSRQHRFATASRIGSSHDKASRFSETWTDRRPPQNLITPYVESRSQDRVTPHAADLAESNKLASGPPAYNYMCSHGTNNQAASGILLEDLI